MSKLKQLIGLQSINLSVRALSRAVGLSVGAVSKHLRALRACKIDAGEAEKLSEVDLDQRVFGAATLVKAATRVAPDCAWIQHELKRHRHVTLQWSQPMLTRLRWRGAAIKTSIGLGLRRLVIEEMIGRIPRSGQPNIERLALEMRSVWHLKSGLASGAGAAHAASNRVKGIAVLYAYFYETGTHSQSRTISITGFVGTLDLWSELEVDWRLILSVLELPHFHASECDAGDGIYSGMGRYVRDALSRALAKIIATHRPMGINAGIFRADWDNFKDGPIGSRFLTPYHFCFEFCMQQISKWSRSDANGESVALIFAEQREYKTNAAKALYDFYRGKSRWGNELVSLTFAPADAVTALQAAGLLSYEINRYVAAKKLNPDTPLRPSMQIMYDDNIKVIGGQYDPEAMGEILREQPR